ncbi:chromosome segregation ATPase [Bradyrhizobium sp. USDA 4011]
MNVINPFRRAKPDARMIELDGLKNKRNDLADQLSAATARLEHMLANASATDDALKLSDELAVAQARVKGITTVLSATETRIAEIESEIDAADRMAKANTAVTEIEKNHNEFVAKLEKLVAAMRDLSPSADRVGVHAMVAREIAVILHRLTEELPHSAQSIADEIRFKCSMLIEEASKPKPKPATTAMVTKYRPLQTSADITLHPAIERVL